VGKSELRTIRVPRWATFLLLLIVSAAMVAAIHFLSGKAYVHDRNSVAKLISIILRYDRGQMSNAALLANIAPAVADALFFVLWGALAFLFFDREGHRAATYAVTMTVGVAFVGAHCVAGSPGHESDRMVRRGVVCSRLRQRRRARSRP